MSEPSQAEVRLSDNALKGKIARLPAKLREEVCRRLHDGQSGPKILPWLNALPEVQAILASEFAGQPVSAQNLSVWRATGYVDWQRRAERIERTRELARYAAEVSRANGGSIADGAASIASGKLLELLEAVDEASGAKLDADALVNISRALAALRGSEQTDAKLALEKKKVSQKDREIDLDEQRFLHEKAALAVEVLKDERAKSIEAGTGTNDEKIEAMGQHLFGNLWKPKK